MEDGTKDNTKQSIALEKDKIKAEEYLRMIDEILNLGKAVILFKGCPTYPKNGALLPEQGTIHIWWIIQDGGLLLLLPFLLSKHPVWAHAEDGNGKKKKNRLRQIKLGVKLRLFAVTTTSGENSDKLHAAVTEHVERVMIMAEVKVIECLAGSNIAEHMRDSRLLSGSTVERTIGLQNREDEGVSTHNMTIGEVFASKSCQEATVDEKEKYGQLNNGSSPIDESASLLNQALQWHSRNANLVE